MVQPQKLNSQIKTHFHFSSEVSDDTSFTPLGFHEEQFCLLLCIKALPAILHAIAKLDGYLENFPPFARIYP